MSIVVAGTGHRPDKLGGYNNAEAQAALFKVARYWLYKQKPSKVISGGALGWDQVLAHAAIHLDIPLVMALPFEGFETKWPRASQEYLHSLMNPAEVVFVCEPGYAPWKMQERNKWMVDNCDGVLAMWDGSNGGTHNCIKYAMSVNRPINNLWSEYESVRSGTDNNV